MTNSELAPRPDRGMSLPPKREQMATGRKPRRTIPDLLRDTFLKGDAGDVVDYVVHDVAIPAAKDTIVSMITDGVTMLFKGEPSSSGYSDRNRYGSSSSKVDYGKPYRNSKPRDRWDSYNDNVPPWADRRRNRIVDVEVDTKEMAEDIRMAIYQDTVDYGMVPVRQLYEMTGLPWKSEDSDYGWSDVSSARIMPTGHGTWKIVMPAPEFLGM